MLVDMLWVLSLRLMRPSQRQPVPQAELETGRVSLYLMSSFLLQAEIIPHYLGESMDLTQN